MLSDLRGPEGCWRHQSSASPGWMLSPTAQTKHPLQQRPQGRLCLLCLMAEVSPDHLPSSDNQLPTSSLHIQDAFMQSIIRWNMYACSRWHNNATQRLCIQSMKPHTMTPKPTTLCTPDGGAKFSNSVKASIKLAQSSPYARVGTSATCIPWPERMLDSFT